VEAFRTPEERFEDLPGLAYESRFHRWGELRLARLDEGDGPPVVMLHGQPTWSYLFRDAFEPLLDAGYRCIAPDLPGFGASDKPLDVGWYTYERHVRAVASLFEELDLRDVTLLMHDWGGPIGLRVATTRLADRVARFVAMDTLVLTGEQDLGDSWRWFRDLVASRDDFPVGRIVRMGCRQRPPREIAAAYDAPFPDVASKAGVRAFPRLVPLSPDNPAGIAGREISAALRDDRRPALLFWAEHDPIFPREEFVAPLGQLFPAAGDVSIVRDAGHFLFEDRGEELGAAVAAWLDDERASRTALAAPATSPRP
jgi:haloalkane dehalogenase